MIKFLLAGLCIFFDVIYIICKEKSKNVIGLFAKCLAAFCFITIGYLGYIDNPSLLSRYILMGLVLDVIGDLFLALRNLFAKDANFIIGTISFLAGHIMFIRSLFLLSNNYLVECVIGGVILSAFVFYLFNRICRFNKIFTLIGICYLAIIYIMALSSIGVYLTNLTLRSLVFMLGAVLFVSSDMILILYNFSKREKWMHPTYSLLYFIAQIFISFSLNI